LSTAEQVSSTVEEYLEAIYRLQERNGAAKTTELAKQLNVALGTITNTVESLEKQSFVVHQPYKGVKLTAKGRRIALGVVRRHRLSERLLVDILKLEWGKAHDAACKLEHAFADKELVEPLEKALGNPKTCPHGNPIPSASGEVTEERSEVLAGLNAGEKGVILKVTDERPDILHYLSKLGIRLGERVLVQEKAPFDGPIMIRIGRSSIALGQNVASVIWVRKTKA
jgi:DtxR family Mn-dependent transcriptional regulator